MKAISEQIDGMIGEWTRLFKALKDNIGDDYRADEWDDKPGMCVTIGFTPASEDSEASWSYQTGDNSYTGGAYGHPHWAVVSLYRRSNSRELAEECASHRLECAGSPVFGHARMSKGELCNQLEAILVAIKLARGEVSGAAWPMKAPNGSAIRPEEVVA